MYGSENNDTRSEDHDKDNEWQPSKTRVFWGEIAPTDHLVQIYENDEVVLAALEGFAASGFQAGDSLVIIATRERLNALHQRLKNQGFDLDRLQCTNQYIALDAHQALAKFMVNGWPDEDLFMTLVKEIITKARGEQNRAIRAYGEMVALLWAKGHNGATVRLEHLWNQFCETEAFCLFCAYPKSGFTQDARASIQHICSAHTKIIDGLHQSTTEVFYKNVTPHNGA